MSNKVEKKEKNIQTKEKNELLNEIDFLDDSEKLIVRIDSEHLSIDGASYEIIENYKDAIDLESIEARYSSLFEKYDYIVGDISKKQLRLRGFYNDANKQVPIDMKIIYLEDYLTEYCSFGCPYFVLKRLDPPKNFTPYKKSNKRGNKKQSGRKKNHRSNKKSKNQKNKKQSTSQKSKSSKQKFVKKERKENKDLSQDTKKEQERKVVEKENFKIRKSNS